MSDALPIPPQASASHYAERAEALLASHGGTHALRAWATDVVAEAAASRRIVADTEPVESAERAVVRLTSQWRTLEERGSPDTAQARAFIADVHGFADWDAFAAHVDALLDPASSVSRFEQAADAIILGDAETLRGLLTAFPTIVHQRSTREHESTLLHYVAANGVEDFRQATPNNIVAIATLLLDAGADVNAESKAYGGGATALGLAATSLHPQRAGVQIALLDLLLARGAWVERPGVAGNGHGAVMGCLANGQPDAAAYLADKGARLGLVEAAGVGRLDDVNRLLHDETTPEAVQSAFMYACGYGHRKVAEVLLARGADVSAPADAAETALHWASGGLHPDVVNFLLAHGAPVDSRDATWDGAPIDWALYSHATSDDDDRRARARDVVTQLVQAGAKFRAEWPGSRLAAALSRDPGMAALLGLPPA